MSRSLSGGSGVERLCRPLLVLIALFCTTEVSWAQDWSQLERLTLPNGLRVVLLPRQDSDVVALSVSYRTGPAAEGPDEHGASLWLAHLMDKGSRNVAAGRHGAWVSQVGGESTVRWTKDWICYGSVVPATQLQRLLWLEADRMKGLALSTRSFERQRQQLANAYATHQLESAQLRARSRLHELAYLGLPEYQRTLWTSPEHLSQGRLQELRRFHNRSQLPNNAVLVITGRFSPDQSKRWLQRHFSSIQPGGALEGPVLPEKLHQSSERLSVLAAPELKAPWVYYGWRVPDARTRDYAAIQLAAEILAGGASASIPTRINSKATMAQRVTVELEPTAGIGLLELGLHLSRKSSVDGVQKLLDGAIHRLRTTGPTGSELRKAKARLKTRVLIRQSTSASLAEELALAEWRWEDPNRAATPWLSTESLTRAQVRDAAARYLGPNQRSIVEVYPPKWPRDSGGSIQTRTHRVKKGETLGHIALMYGSSPRAIAKANRLNPSRPIYPGQRLFVTLGKGKKGPPKKITRTYVVRKGDNLIRIAKRHGTTARAIAAENRLNRKRPIFPGQKLKITTVKGASSARNTKRGSTTKSKRRRSSKKSQSKSKSKSKSKGKRTQSKSTKGRKK